MFWRTATGGYCGRYARLALLVWLVCLLVAGLPWQDFSLFPHWERVTWLPFPVGNRLLDDFLNFAFYLPFGVLGVSWRWRYRRIAGCAAAISLATEVSQLFGRTRYPAATDLITNTAGAVVGALIGTAVVAYFQQLPGSSQSGRWDCTSHVTSEERS